MKTQEYAPARLRTEVIENGLCPLCGGCVAGCPYLGEFQGRVLQLDCCTLGEGTCYYNCPRTFTDLDELSQRVFGEPFSSADLGVVRAAYLARAMDPALRESAGGGGIVPALLISALGTGAIDAVVGTGLSENGRDSLLARNVVSTILAEDTPSGVVTHDIPTVVSITTSPHRFARVLPGFNSLSKDNGQKIGLTCLPCQAASFRKRLLRLQPNRAPADSVALLIAESCATKRWLEPGEDRQKTNTACSYCWDLTGELADISVGSGRAHKGWDTVIVRTAAGEAAFESAVYGAAIESQPLPEENLAAERKASREKKKRGLMNIVARTGDADNLLYLGMPRTLVDEVLEVG